MGGENALAVVFIYVPSEDRCYHQTFTGDDPLTDAHAFMEAEEERGDFPGSLWTVTGNDAAAEIRKRALLAEWGIES